jgi:hypothetical protein
MGGGMEVAVAGCRCGRGMAVALARSILPRRRLVGGENTAAFPGGGSLVASTRQPSPAADPAAPRQLPWIRGLLHVDLA